MPTIVGNSFIPLFAASSGRLKSQVSHQNIVGTQGVWCILIDSVKKKSKQAKRKDRLVPLLLVWDFVGNIFLWIVTGCFPCAFTLKFFFCASKHFIMRN